MSVVSRPVVCPRLGGPGWLWRSRSGRIPQVLQILATICRSYSLKINCIGLITILARRWSRTWSVWGLETWSLDPLGTGTISPVLPSPSRNHSEPKDEEDTLTSLASFVTWCRTIFSRFSVWLQWRSQYQPVPMTSGEYLNKKNVPCFWRWPQKQTDGPSQKSHFRADLDYSSKISFLFVLILWLARWCTRPGTTLIESLRWRYYITTIHCLGLHSHPPSMDANLSCRTCIL